MLLILVLFTFAFGADFGIIGLGDPNSWRLLRILASTKKHRIACFDEREELTRSVISQGGISAFGRSNVFKFSPIVVVFQDNLLEFVESLDADEIKGKEFVFFNRAVDEGSLARQALAKKGASAIMAEFRGDSARLMYPTGAEALRTALASRHVNEAIVDDESHIHRKRDVVCPVQVPGGASLWVKRFTGAQVGCKDVHLSVCRVYAKLPGPDHRLHVVALYDGTGPILTDDPLGFYQAFNHSVLPPPSPAAHENGACDSWLTVGVSEGHTCAIPDPSFNHSAFLSRGRVESGSGFFCSNPFDKNSSPATASKPPNTEDSILIAQLVVRSPHTVSGSAVIISADAEKKQSVAKQSFDCDCE